MGAPGERVDGSCGATFRLKAGCGPVAAAVNLRWRLVQAPSVDWRRWGLAPGARSCWRVASMSLCLRGVASTTRRYATRCRRCGPSPHMAHRPGAVAELRPQAAEDHRGQRGAAGDREVPKPPGTGSAVAPAEPACEAGELREGFAALPSFQPTASLTGIEGAQGGVRECSLSSSMVR